MRGLKLINQSPEPVGTIKAVLTQTVEPSPTLRVKMRFATPHATKVVVLLHSVSSLVIRSYFLGRGLVYKGDFYRLILFDESEQLLGFFAYIFVARRYETFKKRDERAIDLRPVRA